MIFIDFWWAYLLLGCLWVWLVGIILLFSKLTIVMPYAKRYKIISWVWNFEKYFS